MPDLERLGYSEAVQAKILEANIDKANLARVIREHKEQYIVQSEEGIFKAEITGNMRFRAESRADFPAVGDWVEVTYFPGNQAIILKIVPRLSLLERQAVGMHGEKQIIATNIDRAFIVQSVDQNFSLNRLERYLVIAHNGGIDPAVILNKTDLVSEDELRQMKQKVLDRIKDVSVFLTSTKSKAGLQEVRDSLEMGKTYCFLGSSGVGKSSLINYFLGKEALETAEISDSTGKGKHTTSHRELILLDNGSVLIDTPGMRELGLTEQKSGLQTTFRHIAELASECKFADCTHEDEPGCRVLEAMDEGLLSMEEYENFKKLERQSEHFGATLVEKRKKDKAFGKMHKEVIKYKKKNKY